MTEFGIGHPEDRGDGNRFVFSADRVTVLHNAGLFSNCSVSLHAIIRFFNSRKCLPREVDLSASFASFKEAGAGNHNVYEQYFAPDPGMEIAFDTPVDFPLYSLFDYRDEQFSRVQPFVRKYFRPSAAAIAKRDALQARYDLRPDNLLTICYRGTDKFRDTILGSYDTFLDQAERILQKEPDLQVLVQTDQNQFLDRARERLGSVLALDELPRTNSDKVMHSIIKQNKVDWTQSFIGAIDLIAPSRHLVLHTGNVARWLCLYRGNAERVVQFFHPKGASEGAWLGDL